MFVTVGKRETEMKKDKCRFIAETSEIMDSEKPYQLERCRRFGYCESGRLGGCRGCNIWNYLYDIDALKDWCEKQGVIEWSVILKY